MSESARFRAAVFGASGYTGAELVRLLALHPAIDVVALGADRKAGQTLPAVFPHLRHLTLPTLASIDEIDLGAVDILFSALPHAILQERVEALPERLKIIDLSADFRLEDPESFERWYGVAHRAQSAQRTAVYGLPEIYRSDIAGARLIANTGCYVATALLPLIPLLRRGVIEPDPIVIDAKSGVSGAGRAAKEGTLFCEVAEGFHAYGVGGHRHMAELDQELSKAAGREVRPSFTPHLLPQNRGILATIYARGEPEAAQAALAAAYHDAYFVQVLPLGETPHTRHVRGSNFAHIGVAADRAPGRVILVSTLDNLVKGASGQAVQNANLALGLDETLGLTQAPLFP